MKNESKATPGPWKVHHHDHHEGEQWLSILHGAWDITHNHANNNGVVADAKYSAMSDEENLANAEFIVRACNSHHELLEALKYIRRVTNKDDPRWSKANEAIKKAEEI